MANQTSDDMKTSAEKELVAILNESQLDLNVDIDKILDDKAKKNQLSTINVKNLIKNILTNADVATMLRQTLDDNGDGSCLYEPKLTRAKIREMLKDYPPSVNQWSPNQQQTIISECRSLIEKEFPDDSEDEEYHPDKTIEEDDEEDDDDDESKCTEINKSFETECETENNISEYQTTTDLNDMETIGMRTRSKFSLNDTPLEIIEQAFIPPDITEDMYDSACENDEWMEFLSEFTKPLEPVPNDDAEDDPEYNVLCDDDFTNVDKEEFRIDRSVRISRKEYNELMNELYEFTESYLEFNGGESLETSTDVTESVNNKSVVKHKNIVTNVNTSNHSVSKSNSLCSTNDKNVVIPKIVGPLIAINTLNCSDSNYKHVFTPIVFTPITPTPFIAVETVNNSDTNYNNVVKPKLEGSSNTVNTLNHSDSISSATCSTNNVNVTGIISYNTQFEKQRSVPQLHNHEPIINKQIEKSRCILSSSTSVFNSQSNIKKRTNSVCNKINTIPQYVNNNGKTDGMLKKQLILLKQQFIQHVQLLTQTYILCTMNKSLSIHCQKLHSMLVVIDGFDKKKPYVPINIRNSFRFINKWFDTGVHDVCINSDNIQIPSSMKKFMLFFDKPLFIYPQLLPSRTFHLFSKISPMGPSEENLLVLKIDQVFKKLIEDPRTRHSYKDKDLSEMMPKLVKIVHQRWFSHRRLTDIRNLITRRRNSAEKNIVKKYLKHGKIREIVHKVDLNALKDSKCLYECDIKKFPKSWKALVSKLKLRK